MVDERGRATGEAEGAGCGALPWNNRRRERRDRRASATSRRAFVPWSTSGAGPQAEPKAPAVGHFHGTIVAGSVSDRRAFVPWSTSGAGPQAEPKAPAVGHVHGTIVAGSVSDRRAFVPWSTSGAGPQADRRRAVGHFDGTVAGKRPAGVCSMSTSGAGPQAEPKAPAARNNRRRESDRRAFVPWSTSGAGPQAEPKAPAWGTSEQFAGNDRRAYGRRAGPGHRRSRRRRLSLPWNNRRRERHRPAGVCNGRERGRATGGAEGAGLGHFHGRRRERQRPAGVCSMVDERGRATGGAEGAGCGALPGTIVAGSVICSMRRAGPGHRRSRRRRLWGTCSMMDRRFRFQHYVSFPARELGYVITFRSGHRNRASVVREGRPYPTTISCGSSEGLESRSPSIQSVPWRFWRRSPYGK